MSLMDMFRGAPKTDEKPAGEEKKLSDSPATTQADGKMPGTGETPVNPLDEYKKMFDTANSSSEMEAPEFKLDSKVLGEVSSKMDFTKGINPEAMQKALAGDAQALLKVIQTTSQNAYKAAIEHSTSLTDTFVKTRGDFESKKINSSVKSHLTDQALSSTPNYDHPVVRNELNRIASQFARANPDASPQDVAKSAQKYMTDLFSAMNPATKDENTSQTEDFDWASYITKQ